MARATSRKSSRVVSVDMTGVEVGGGGGFRIPEGPYGMRCDEVKKGVSQNDNEQLEWIFKGTEGKAKGKTFYYYTTLTESSLWKLRETLEGLGVEVPDSPMDIDLDELEGAEGIGNVVDDEYRNKIRSKLDGFVLGDETEEAEEEPDKPTRRGAGGKNKKAPPKIAAGEVEEMGEDDLEGVVEKYSIELDLGDFKTLSKKRAAVIEALEEAEMIEEEEPEPAVTSRRNRRK